MSQAIIIGIDGSSRGDDACVLGGVLARLGDAPVILSHVVAQVFPDNVIHPSRYTWTAEQQAEAGFDRGEKLVGAVSEVHREVVLARSPAAGLHWLAEQDDARFVVVGSSHRGAVGRLTIGSVGERLLYGSPSAVAVATHGYAQTGASVATVGVAFDGSPEAAGALRAAAEFAGKAAAAIRLIAVYDPRLELHGPRAASGGGAFPRKIRDDLHESAKSAAASLPDALRADVILSDGAAEEILIEQSRELDLLVCGSRSYGPARTVLLGGVSRLLVREAACPVIVIPRVERG